jgi:hypothetical protein
MDTGFPFSTLKVLGHKYTVALMSSERAEEAECVGLLDRNRLTIFVAEHLAPSKRAEVLLHEVIHAATDATGLMDAPGREDENVVNPLSRALFTILTDNPLFTAYLLSFA